MSQSRPRHRMIDRVAELLETAARNRSGLTLSELSRAVDAPLSSTQGLVNGLVATGYLDEHDKRYTLGLTPHILNQLAGRGTLNRVGHADLVELAAETGFTAYLSVRMGADSIYLDHAQAGDDAVSDYVVASNRKRPLLHSSAGWQMLAASEPRDMTTYLDSVDGDADAKAAFLTAAKRIRAERICSLPGYSLEPDHDGISVPLVDHGKTVAAVGIMGLSEQLARDEERLKEILVRHSTAWHARA